MAQSQHHRPSRMLLVACALLGFTLNSLPGCGGSCDTFIASADLFVNRTVGPEYELYVQSDVNLDEAEKAVRLQNVESFRNFVSEYQKGR